MMCDMKQELMGPEFEGYLQSPGASSCSSNSMPVQIKAEVEEDETSQSSNGLSSAPPVQKEPKKRGRPKKVKEESAIDADGKSTEKKMKHEASADSTGVVKKRRDRFNGMPEEEVVQKLLPDHLAHNLDILIVGINPGLFAAYVGHHYAGPGNHFWKCLYLSGLIPEPMNAYDDYKLLNLGIGFTNICARTTKGSADLKKAEIKEGAEILKRKILEYCPKIVAFNGKGIYEVFSGNKNFHIGKQPDKIEGSDTVLYVMPSSSARCAQLPRALDKVPFYLGLKKLRDYLKGDLASLEESEIVFPNVDLRSKGEIHDDQQNDDEDDVPSAGPTASSKDLTLEQIQMQAEYQEALIASAEGIDVLDDTWGRNSFLAKSLRNNSSLDTVDSSKFDYQLPSSISLPSSQYTNSPFISYKSPCSDSGSRLRDHQIKDEPFDYEGVAMIAPTAQKVNIDSGEPDPSQCHSSSPQYICLGDLPSSKSAAAKQLKAKLSKLGKPSVTSRTGSVPSSTSHYPSVGQTPISYQHSFSRIHHSPLVPHNPMMYNKGMGQAGFGDKGIQNFST